MDAAYWINKLNLLAHPEGGYYKEIYRSEEFIEQTVLPNRYSSKHSLSTSIYFLLNKNQISAFHKLQSDEIWHYHTGASLKIHIISNDGNYKEVKLGLSLEDGESPQIIIPHNHWFAAELLDKSSFTLIGCTVAPGFDFTDFILGKQDILKKLFPQHSDLIVRMTNK